MPVFSLVYLSRARIECTPQQLQDIVKSSQQSNQKSNITGMLLVSDGYFFQLLEGDEDTVRKLFKVITEDKRHDEVRLLLADNVSKRYCPNWSMTLLINHELKPVQTKDKIDSLLALSNQNYLHKDQLISDLFCRFMTVRQLEEFRENTQTV